MGGWGDLRDYGLIVYPHVDMYDPMNARKYVENFSPSHIVRGEISLRIIDTMQIPFHFAPAE